MGESKAPKRKRVVSVRIGDSAYRRVEARAKKAKRTVSSIICEIVEKHA